MLAIFLFIILENSIYAMNLSKRETQKYQQQVNRIEKRQIGSLIISMIQLDQPQINQLIEQSIEDFELEYSTLQDFHISRKTQIYQSMQQLKAQLLDLDLLQSSFIDGPQEKEREFHEQKIVRLNQLINQNYKMIDQKEVQLIKMQNSLSSLIDEYDININQIDQMLQTIDSILYDEEKVGIKFFQKRGRVNEIIENFGKSTIKNIKLDLPMLKQVIQIGIKNNFAEKQTYKQVQELLISLRNKLVGELNSLNTDKIDQLELNINELKNETLKLKSQLLESTQKLQIENRDISAITDSKKRIEQELIILDEDLRLENELFNQKETFLIEEVNELMEIEQLLKNREFIQYIQDQEQL
ncbi:unnamed protein product [Paramecium primaurelia]|uniref:Uncharacterized protein n=1 Tax=Paramecium primaurelia TaxID=5886 RepID=A0A8S1KDC1_PARPR|nr:unnamed protein product [Paramecium primaurelia]